MGRNGPVATRTRGPSPYGELEALFRATESQHRVAAQGRLHRRCVGTSRLDGLCLLQQGVACCAHLLLDEVRGRGRYAKIGLPLQPLEGRGSHPETGQYADGHWNEDGA